MAPSSADEHAVAYPAIGTLYKPPNGHPPVACPKRTPPPNTMSDEGRKQVFTATCENLLPWTGSLQSDGTTCASFRTRPFHSSGCVSVQAARAKYTFALTAGSGSSPPCLRVFSASARGLSADAREVALAEKHVLQACARISIKHEDAMYVIERIPSRKLIYAIYRKLESTSSQCANIDASFRREQVKTCDLSSRKLQCVGLIRLKNSTFKKDMYELSFWEQVSDLFPILSVLLIKTWCSHS